MPNQNITSSEKGKSKKYENISLSIPTPLNSSNPLPTPPPENENVLAEKNEIEKKMTEEGWYMFHESGVLGKALECEQWLHRYNQSLALPLIERDALFRERIGHVGKGVRVKPPFFCYMGFNIHLADNVFMNFNCCLVDGAPIEIGENTLLGPYVRIVTADHPRDPKLRAADWERAMPVRIGRNCWIGTGSAILPGVTIGDNCIVGANSVVTKDVPSNSTVVGAPARPIAKRDKAKDDQ